MIEGLISVEAMDQIIPLMLREPVIRQHVLAQQTLQAALSRYAASVSGLACAAVQQQLATYLDAEQLGTAEQAMYRQLVLHVQHCPLCFELYHDACHIIAAQAAGLLPTWPQQPAQP